MDFKDMSLFFSSSSPFFFSCGEMGGGRVTWTQKLRSIFHLRFDDLCSVWPSRMTWYWTSPCNYQYRYHYYYYYYSPSRGGRVTIYVPDVNQLSLPTPFYSALVSDSVFMVLSTVFHSINSPNSCPLSHSVLPVLFCFIGPLNYISLHESLPQPWYNPLCLIGLKAPTN